MLKLYRDLEISVPPLASARRWLSHVHAVVSLNAMPIRFRTFLSRGLDCISSCLTLQTYYWALVYRSCRCKGVKALSLFPSRHPVISLFLLQVCTIFLCPEAHEPSSVAPWAIWGTVVHVMT